MYSLIDNKRADMLKDDIEEFLAKGGQITDVPPVDLEIARAQLEFALNHPELPDPIDEDSDEDFEDVDDLELTEDDLLL